MRDPMLRLRAQSVFTVDLTEYVKMLLKKNVSERCLLFQVRANHDRLNIKSLVSIIVTVEEKNVG